MHVCRSRLAEPIAQPFEQAFDVGSDPVEPLPERRSGFRPIMSNGPWS